MSPTHTANDDRPLIAIDAGQTGIRMRYTTPDASEELEAEGIDAASDTQQQIERIVLKVCAHHGWRPATAAIGLTGLVIAEARAGDLLRAWRATGVSRVLIAHDSVTSYLSALELDPGVVVAAGTGVVILAAGPSGTARVDGWGHLLGDAGGGFWLGRAGLDAALREHDGRGPATALTRDAAEMFGPISHLTSHVQERGDRVRAVAAFARCVLRRAAEGDATALRIADDGARELASSAIVALDRAGLGASEPATVSWTGSLLSGSEVYRAQLQGHLARRRDSSRLVPPRAAPLDGCARLQAVPDNHPLRDSIASAAISPREGKLG
jgi:N-acetylglucosamine kinase-like BadF-type ATPase